MVEQKLKEYFGFDSFRKGQKEVIERVSGGASAAAIFPTGAGKSLCYQLSAMMLPGLTLVVSPLLSLMKDQLDFLKEYNIPAERLDSTLGKTEYNRVINEAKQGVLKILMISVERFRNERFRGHLSDMNISLLVIDEAHCISEWGHNFRPDYLKLPVYRKEFNIPQVLLLTATATGQVIKDMCTKLEVPKENVTLTGFYRKNLFLQISPAGEAEKKAQLLTRIKENPELPTIVYVTLQKTAAEVAAMLKEHGIQAHPYHAGMKNEERELIQNRFMSGKIHCVAATIAFGMGIDKKDIRRVIHYDLPKSIENYSQEIGRSGRDGEDSFCEVLANRDNITVLKNFVYGDTPDKKGIRSLLKRIQDKEMWEVKLHSLPNRLDIRILPLKTLLVYLEMEGIISPLYTYFESYQLKYKQPPEEILGVFKEERRDFVNAIIENSPTKRVWTHVNIPVIQEKYPCERLRIVKALGFFEEQGWIHLEAKQSVDVYRIDNPSFDLENTAEKLYSLFAKKEDSEAARIDRMIHFFESPTCLSSGLAGYFGETIEAETCGHCSCCREGQKNLESSLELQPLERYKFYDLSKDILWKANYKLSHTQLAKFFCGINTPVFTKLGARRIAHFAALENHPFKEVKEWARINMEQEVCSEKE